MALKILQNNTETFDRATGRNICRATLLVDTADELPAADALGGMLLSQGSTATVITEGCEYQLDSTGTWRQRGKVNFNSAADLASYVKAGTAAKLCNYGDLIEVERTTSDGVSKTYAWEVYGINEDGDNTLTLRLYRPYDLKNMGDEALAYFPEGLEAGNYSISLPSSERSCLGDFSPETIYFHTSEDIPAGGQLAALMSTSRQAWCGLQSFADAEATEPIEELGNGRPNWSFEPADGATYTDLGTADGTTEHINHISRALQGTSDWELSDLRDWLNDDRSP